VAPSDSRRLCALLDAGQSRYCVEAVAVVEVANAPEGEDTLRGHLPLKDLSALLGGLPEVQPGKAVVLDSSPTVALRVARVEGVVDTAGKPTLPLPRRLVPLLSPVVRGGVVLDGRLFFELDAESVGRGLPKQSRRPEVVSREAAAPALVFESGEATLGVPLQAVRQVVARGPGFNPAPSPGAFLGVLVHERQLVPAWSLSGAGLEDLFVLVEVTGGDRLALSARRADGVRPPERLDGVTVVDLPRTFS